VGNYGIDRLWYLLVEPATPTPTPTLTPTDTPTPTPNSNGSGTCWHSGASWSDYDVTYNINPLVPSSFVASIENAAQTWVDATPSHFAFHRWTQSANLIKYEEPSNPEWLAGTVASPSAGPITFAHTKINPNMAWDTNIPPSSTAYSVQEVMTHEFGHWLYLHDMYDATCTHVTMDHDIAPGEVIKMTLDIADENAINWQYP
jgi:hypothetical protein